MSRGTHAGARSRTGSWALWIGSLVGAALFAGAMSGMAYVRKSYEPSVGYSAINKAELEASGVETASAPSAPVKNRWAKAPTAPRTNAAPTTTPQEARPKSAKGKAASAKPSESTRSAEPSPSPEGPLGGLGTLLNGGKRR